MTEAWRVAGSEAERLLAGARHGGPAVPTSATLLPPASVPLAVPDGLEQWPTPPGDWPAGIWRVPYDTRAVPGTARPHSWLHGSNCQRFAYGVLGLFGRSCPTLRSSELWNDAAATSVVRDPQPLDLVLFNSGADPYGAHVGIWMAPDTVLHLCQEIGRPISWPLASFAERPRYRIVIGFKRVAAGRETNM